MLDAVLLLGLKTGWTRTEICALSHSDLKHHLDRLTHKTDG